MVKRYTCEGRDELGYAYAALRRVEDDGTCVDSTEYDALRADNEALKKELAGTRANGVAHAWRADALQAELTACKASFKNFHRFLCERFGYCHDEIDWERDQVSLIEWIAKAREDYIEPWKVARTELDQCKASLSEARAAIFTYGAHRPSCPRSAKPPGDATCTCGLHALFALKSSDATADREVKP